MPRVNRDLQRRLAARRERERRRPPAERRYRFASAEPAVEPEESLTNGAEAGEAVETRPARPARGTRAAGAVEKAASPARAGAKPISNYKTEYAYVLTDLKRVALVIGSLLLILILLYIVLPH